MRLEVGASERAIGRNCGSVISLGGIDNGGKVAKMFVLAIDEYIGDPLTASPVKASSLVSRLIVAGLATIFSVLGIGSIAQIDLSVIQSVVVYVVSDHAIWGLKNKSVHVNTTPSFLENRVKVFRSGILFGTPFESGNHNVIIGIDDCKLIFSERDETIFRWGHDRSSKRLGCVRRLQRLTPLFYQRAA